MDDSEKLTPQKMRHQNTKRRLRAALQALAILEPRVPITVASVAREAGVGRNAIYVGHDDVLQEIRRIAVARSGAKKKHEYGREMCPEYFHDLKRQLAHLATENAGLLKRACLAESRLKSSERRNALLLKEIADIRRPIHLGSIQSGNRKS